MKHLAWRLLFERAEHWILQLIRSGMASISAAVGDYGLLILLVESFGMRAVRASVFAFLFGLCINYLFTALWVFPGSDHGHHRLQLFYFILTAGTALVLHTALMVLFVEQLGMYYVPAKALSMVAAFLWNFSFRKITHIHLTEKSRR
ncbi:MAG: GtrA family protein [Spirochaetaceae bacterium]